MECPLLQENDGGRMTADSGARLLRASDRLIDVTQRLADAVVDDRGSGCIGTMSKTLIE